MLEEERKMVLQMLAEGKISAEQAAELLRALGDSATSGEVADDMPSGSVSDSVREAVRRAREAAREAAHTAREEARRARDGARQAAREARRQVTGFDVDLGGIGAFVEGLVNRITQDFSPFGYRWEETYDGNFDAEPVQLDVNTNNGSIHLHSWTLSTYKIVLHVQAGGADEAEARRRAQEAIRLEHGAAGITLRVNDGWASRVGAAVELYLPEGPEYRLKAVTGNGSIHLESGRFASAWLRTGNGSVHSSATVGDLDANTGNGSIHAAARSSGQWNLATGAGSVHVDSSGLGDTAVEVNASTAAGRVQVDIPGASTNQGGLGHVAVRLSSPNFEQAASRLTLRARTGLGSITVRNGA